MIIWLASYPKSGNTLLRSILATYFYSNDGDFKFKHLYKISQFPAVEHFINLGINILGSKILILPNTMNLKSIINQVSSKEVDLKFHSSLLRIS